jgi:hypothetical protein
MDLTNSNNVFGVFTGWSETANVFDCVGTLNSGCGTVNTMNFLNTGAFSLNLPNGATYDSASGQFLTQQGEVPEPRSAMLCAAGLAAIFWIRRVQR